MEALLILLAPLIEICLVPLAALAGAMISILAELVFAVVALLVGVIDALRGSRRGPTPKKQAAPRKPLVPRKLLHWSAGVLLAVGLAGLAASYLFFDPILRYGLSRAEAKTGVEIRYERSAGNLLWGQVSLEGIHMRRSAEEGLAFDIQAERVALDVVLTSLLGEPEIESAEVIGVRGFVTPPAREKDKPDGGKRSGRAFHADDIMVEDVALEVRPRTGAAYPFAITQARVAPFRSRSALFDLLFRSNMQARVAGQSLSVETREVTEYGRETFWRFEEVDVAKLAAVVPRAPMTWLREGRMSAIVEDRWSLSEDWIEMDWRFLFEGIEVAVPDEAGLREKALAAGFGRLVAARDGDAEFHYRLRLNQNDIAMARSGDLSGFWDVIASQLVNGATTPEAVDAAKETDSKVRGALDRMKGLLRRDRGGE
ncbi:AsmA family protein [Marimonas lutisalis]|uniref:hypothetical protein n=1 Tax=Marimonas lutisalis TaxID=2545756 RepID=UPI0010F9D788|nr:hypothetical protein [Marimonas lutisalis]